MARAAEREGANAPPAAEGTRSSTELEPTEARGTMQGVGLPKKAPRRAAPLAGLRSKIVGIDFGTSYTSISVAVDSHVALIPDEQGRVLHPSVVSYPNQRAPLVGWAARPRLIQDPRRTVPSAKRLLGRGWSDPKIAGYLHSSTFRTSAGPNDAIVVELDDRQVAIPQVCAEILGHVRDLAERRLKDSVREVALSVPVTFTEVEKAALRKAALIAGLDVVGLVEEPVAGALAYGLGQSVNEIVAVYDFGGGTFDFSILDVSNERFRVLACDGDSWLGGDDFDLALAQAVADALWRATRVELRQRIVEWQRLILACEEAKRTLSTEPLAYVVVDGIIEQPKRIDLRQKVDRAIFERLCRDLVGRSLDIVKNTLARAGLEPQHVTQVIATGGVSRIPFVRRALEQVFERPIEPVVSPEEAIAIGAGVRAAKLANHPLAATAFV
jgi:molecular chaperone DnaK